MTRTLSRRTLLTAAAAGPLSAQPRTEIAIRGDEFILNGRPTYQGRTFRDAKIQGLLLNTRMVQGIFDDLNPETRDRWKYPDTGKWDPERNVREFLRAMPEWRKHGVLSFTINLQGGSPEGYSKAQPWHNSALAEDGALRPEYMRRLQRILDRADELGMVPIVGIYYFGQDQRLRDEAAIRKGVENAVDWLLRREHRNLLLEVNNECDVRAYDHEILKPARVHELIEMARAKTRNGRRLLVGTSYGGGKVPTDNVVKVSDFVLIHGNGVKDPARIREMVEQTRRLPSWRPMPILFNEDDHFDFEQPDNNMWSAIRSYASWGYFDPGKNDYENGYQCPPVNWGLNTPLKRGFFEFAKEITGV